MEEKLCDLKVHINGQHTFFLNQRTLCSFSIRLKKMVRQQRKISSSKGMLEIKIKDFPCGANGFEMISRFCYNNGRIPMSPSNICILHCSALLLEMTEDISTSNLLSQADTFLDGLFYWTWDDILTSLKSCEPLFYIADSSGLLIKLISSVLSKISEHSERPLSPSPSSSPRTPDSVRHSFTNEWWFDDLSDLPPNIVSKILKMLGAYGSDNKNLILTRFLLHYLKKSVPRSNNKSEFGGLADTAIFGVVLTGKAAFSCRGLFWVLRIVSKFGLGKECRQKLETAIGSMMDQATLDDLLVSGHNEGVYDVNLVLRLVRVFVSGVEDGGVELKRMKKVGRLVDKYLGEISPDQGLKISKFLAVAESLPDSSRDCFDGVYRALEIYLEAHPALSSEDRSRLCRCLNYEKLTLEACKDLAKNPRVPPGAAIHAMVSQQSKVSKTITDVTPKLVTYKADDTASSSCEQSDEKEELKLNLHKMQNRVVELEKVCKEMKCQMTRMVKGRGVISRTKLC